MATPVHVSSVRYQEVAQLQVTSESCQLKRGHPFLNNLKQENVFKQKIGFYFFWVSIRIVREIPLKTDFHSLEQKQWFSKHGLQPIFRVTRTLMNISLF